MEIFLIMFFVICSSFLMKFILNNIAENLFLNVSIYDKILENVKKSSKNLKIYI